MDSDYENMLPMRKLSLLKESEDHIEFKEAKHNFDYNGGSHKDPKEQRRPKHHKLNVFQLMAIYNVCFGDGLEVKAATVDELVEDGILLRSKTGKLSMAKEYKKIVAEIGHRGPVNGDVNGDVKSLKGVLKEIYMIVYSNPGIKTLRVAEIRRKSESTVWKQLNELRKKGIIEYRGSDRSGGYYVVEKKTDNAFL